MIIIILCVRRMARQEVNGAKKTSMVQVNMPDPIAPNTCTYKGNGSLRLPNRSVHPVSRSCVPKYITTSRP